MSKTPNREVQCRICHAQLERREWPRPGDPGFCDRCLRNNQSTTMQHTVEPEWADVAQS